MWNILNLRLFMKQPVAWRAFTGGVLGLILSTFFEEYQWSVNAVLGVIVVLVGNLIILTPAETLEK
jgi:hypothetical protein